MRKFLYYILKEDGRSGKVVNNVVTYSGVPTPLQQTPDGWQSLQIAWQRSLTDHSVGRVFTLPFGFVRDAAKIIRDALYNEGLETKIFLLIQALTLVLVPNVSYNWLYAYLYKGEIDLPAADDKEDMISVPCLEGGVHKLLSSNRSKKYTLPFDLESSLVKMDGILFDVAGHFINPELSNPSERNYILPFGFVSKEGYFSTDVAFLNASFDVLPSSGPIDLAANPNYFFYTGSSKTVRIKGSIKFYIPNHSVPGDVMPVRFIFQDNFNTVHYDTNPTNSILYPVNSQSEVTFDFTVTLPADCKLFTYHFNPYAFDDELTYFDTNIDITFDYTFKQTFVKAYTKSVLYRKLVKEVAGDESYASSQLCSDWDYIVVTSGDAIRGIENPTITTSLDDFFEDMDKTFMAGIGVENNRIKLESRETFYDTSNPVDLGIIKDFSKTPAKELIANKFKAGHVKPDIEDISGKSDPNGSSEYSGPYTKLVREYNMVSPYKAGPFEIESLRLNLDGKVTTDDNRDSDVYVINCNPLLPINATISFFAAGFFIISSAEGLAEGQQIQIQSVSGTSPNDGIYNITGLGSLLIAQIVAVTGTLVDEADVPVTITILRGGILTLNRPAYDTLEGVPNDTIFNLPQLTPKAMLKAHGRWIRSMHYKLDTLKIKFNSGDKNTGLLTEIGGVTIDEDGEESISDLGEPMWLPFYFNFATEVPTNLVDILETTPNRCFQFTDRDGNVWKGFLVSAALAPNERKEQEFKLLAAPDNDLSLLAA